eukprot:CAMPEP_0115877464 /NCGR_PEP_ID=MMETSP0287-20121206/26239_1 /TAXON_ID=412157 /ORGANISM="Chrysochromulina rotalis, Strain UIO044" /LENGTH=68 /DNA_ID=CAMNT_0003332985 /DNA_START=88 /DNA_END=291 /DNA_ORIENTATION=+
MAAAKLPVVSPGASTGRQATTKSGLRVAPPAPSSPVPHSSAAALAAVSRFGTTSTMHAGTTRFNCRCD